MSGACVDKTLFTNSDASELIQDIFRGKHPACDGMIVQDDTESNIVQNSLQLNAEEPMVNEDIDVVLNEIPEIIVEPRTSMDDDGSSIITASLVAALVALVVGYLAGFLTAKKCTKDNYKSCGHHYLEQHLNK